MGLISEADYARDISNAALFLQGKESEVIDTLTAKMEAAAAEQNYESAAVSRDQIRTL